MIQYVYLIMVLLVIRHSSSFNYMKKINNEVRITMLFEETSKKKLNFEIALSCIKL